MKYDTLHIFIILLLIGTATTEKLLYSENIAIIGTGYVGLVSGAGLAALNNNVICADIDQRKIFLLKQRKIPIYEPGLLKLVEHNVIAKRLSFTNDIDKAIQDSNIIFIAVGTPMNDKGLADLSAVINVVNAIAQNINTHKIIVTKSTVPIGTGKKIRTILEQQGVDPTMFDIVSNPEFLREGSAVSDFTNPDRLVIGAESNYACTVMCKIYESLITSGTPHVLTNVKTAEFIKYASNGFLATKLSYMNEIANLCDATGANAQTVAFAMGLDQRISRQFLNASAGWGGSCFQKDSETLVNSAQQHKVPLHIVNAALHANKIQKKKPTEKLFKLMHHYCAHENLQGKTVAVLGLSFKANTDDVRCSPAITTIKLLLEKGIVVKAYDPAAMHNMKKIFPDIIYCPSLYKAVTDANAIIIMTEWDEFKQMDIERVSTLVQNRIIIDVRNIMDFSLLKHHDFICDTIGTSCLHTSKYFTQESIPVTPKQKQFCRTFFCQP